MKRKILMLALVAIAVAGCSNSDYGNRSPNGLPPAGQLDFTTFVITQYSSTNETALPVEVDQTNFGFGDQDNTSAFNTLLAVAP